jgi:hypothetical protein
VCLGQRREAEGGVVGGGRPRCGETGRVHLLRPPIPPELSWGSTGFKFSKLVCAQDCRLTGCCTCLGWELQHCVSVVKYINSGFK